MSKSKVVHDAEHYILYDQNGKKWDAEDQELDQKLAELKKKYGTSPNIIHIMWDDMAFGDLGIPGLSKEIRGFESPNIDRMVKEGITFTRMCTEPACTPSRAAVITGRHPVRYGMSKVGWPLEFGGLRKEEVTTAEVLSKAGYATGFYSKWHLGDIEESYPHNQGFDEALFTPYNQVSSGWNAKGDAVNMSLGIAPEISPKDPHRIDQVGLIPHGWVQTIEGKKGELGREWGEPTAESYDKIDGESEKRIMEFMQRNANAKKPFFISYWPNMLSLFPDMKKETIQRGLIAEGFKKVDKFIGQLMDELKKLGIAENTLIVAMADNGPMVHNPPPGLGLTDTIFRGGKGDFTEGGVRVPAFAWWPGMIKPGQIVSDLIHETDLFTTFARLGDATKNIPTDRVIDGLDQTALLLNGDTHGRRDYLFIYAGDTLGATVKDRYKRHWVSSEGAGTGTAAAFFDLFLDPREQSPLLVPLIYTSSQFDRMRVRHELWKKKYPDKPEARGIPFTGIENARPETKMIGKRIEELRKTLPFDPLEYLDVELPFEKMTINTVD